MKIFLQSLFIVLIGLQGICVGSPTDPINLGFRRELFIDRFLIAEMTGVELRLHEPKLAPATSGPADNLEYGTVIKDGDVFRLYTRDGRGAKFDGDSTEVTRYCESRDGIHWTRPNLATAFTGGELLEGQSVSRLD